MCVSSISLRHPRISLTGITSNIHYMCVRISKGLCVVCSTSVHVCMYGYVHLYMYVYICALIYVCMDMCTYICMYGCVVWVHTYGCAHTVYMYGYVGVGSCIWGVLTLYALYMYICGRGGRLWVCSHYLYCTCIYVDVGVMHVGTMQCTCIYVDVVIMHMGVLTLCICMEYVGVGSCIWGVFTLYAVYMYICGRGGHAWGCAHTIYYTLCTYIYMWTWGSCMCVLCADVDRKNSIISHLQSQLERPNGRPSAVSALFSLFLHIVEQCSRILTDTHAHTHPYIHI